MKKYGNIEILYDLDTEFFKREFIQKCRPAIIKGAVKSWPAFIRWDSEYLIKNIGNVLVKFRCANNCQFPNPDNIEENVIQEKTFSEYLK